MPYNTPDYSGDDIYTRPTDDLVLGDEIRFQRATFSGSFRRPKFAGFETITGTVIAESYGADKQQHTFTLDLAAGGKLLIKGRNIYKNGVWRKPRCDAGEIARSDAAEDKHARGDKARAARRERIEGGASWM